MHITPENVEEYIPEQHRLIVRHLHEGNDPKGNLRKLFQNHMRKEKDYRGKDNTLPKYVTVALIENEDADKDYTIVNVEEAPGCYGFAVCMKGDTPHRRLGWEIAVSRACERFYGTKQSK